MCVCVCVKWVLGGSRFIQAVLVEGVEGAAWRGAALSVVVVVAVLRSAAAGGVRVLEVGVVVRRVWRRAASWAVVRYPPMSVGWEMVTPIVGEVGGCCWWFWVVRKLFWGA
ncbi:hypothetical protein B0T19DRAFT_423606 [Cercophora scortea]|uniref:Uncharacterized protein n=1 Tax=Cercophora scortea TaxID=314031 RepID=A0AAE0MD14_9PEZI|nr:hypothetical protein B0T19DRAFT_423606 [Cercophora scortea]